MYSQYAPSQNFHYGSHNNPRHTLFIKRKLSFVINLPKQKKFAVNGVNEADAPGLTQYSEDDVIIEW